MNLPTERGELTQYIRSMYEALPFPGCEYHRKQGVQLGIYLARQARRGGRSLLGEGVRVLDAGCGTGSTVNALARGYPESSFVGLDMTRHSLDKAGADAARMGLGNIKFVQGDIQTVELPERFDVIISFGVLIVMADPVAGLRRLVAHLAPEGRVILWLYGSHGRYRLQLNQRMLALVTPPDASWQERVDLAKTALRSLPREHLACYFSVPEQAIEGDFEQSLEWILGNDSWIADQFIHPYEKSYDMAGLLELLGAADLEIDQWIGVDTNIDAHTSDEDVRRRVRALPVEERYKFFDLLLKPVDYFVACRKRGA